MGSRRPPSSYLSASETQEHDAQGRLVSPDQQATRQLLKRVASTLGVPLESLYKPNDATPLLHGTSDGEEPAVTLNSESIALLRAYSLIQDPEVRREILALAQEASSKPKE